MSDEYCCDGTCEGEREVARFEAWAAAEAEAGRPLHYIFAGYCECSYGRSVGRTTVASPSAAPNAERDCA